MKPGSLGRCMVVAVGLSTCGGNGLRSADHQLDAGRDSLAPASGGGAGSGAATPSGGVSASGGTTTSVDAASLGGTGGAPGSGGVSAGTDGGAGAGGAVPTEKPRVLLVRPPALLRACDADGQTVTDYQSALDFGADYGRRTIWLGGWVRWDDGGAPGLYPLNYRDPGASRFMMAAYPSATPVDAQLDAQLKVLTVDGKVEARFPIPQSHTQLALSPRGNYLYIASDVGKSGDPSYCQKCAAVILRSKDGSTVGQGFLTSSNAYPGHATFSPDDRYFVYVTSKCEEGLHILDLSDGETAIIPQSSLPCPKQLATDSRFSVGSWNDGVIVFCNMNPSSADSGLGLWSVNWQGRAVPFASSPPSRSTYDALLRVHPDGQRALWSRTSNGVAETFEFDRSTLQSRPFADAHPECYGQPAATRYQVQGQSVVACPCGQEACTPFATLPTLQEPYTPALSLSPDRRFVVVGYDWSLDSLPRTHPQALLYDARGTVLLTLPNGAISFDRTSSLAMDCYNNGTADAGCALINLAAASITTLPRVDFGFLYE